MKLQETTTRQRTLFNIGLYLVLVVLLCLSLGLALVQQQSDVSIKTRAQILMGQDDEVAAARAPRDQAGNDLHTSVIRAATDQALAMANFDYKKPKEARDRILAGATGELAEEYKKTFKSLRKVSKQAESELTGRIVSAGVLAADDESATVIVALAGTIENIYTEGKRANSPTMRLELQWQDGRWLTSNLIYLS